MGEWWPVHCWVVRLPTRLASFSWVGMTYGLPTGHSPVPWWGGCCISFQPSEGGSLDSALTFFSFLFLHLSGKKWLLFLSLAPSWLLPSPSFCGRGHAFLGTSLIGACCPFWVAALFSSTSGETQLYHIFVPKSLNCSLNWLPNHLFQTEEEKLTCKEKEKAPPG